MSNSRCVLSFFRFSIDLLLAVYNRRRAFPCLLDERQYCYRVTILATIYSSLCIRQSRQKGSMV